MFLTHFAFILLSTLVARTESLDQTFKAVILCYATDPITNKVCDEIERKLSKCNTNKTHVIRKNTPTLDSLPLELSKEKIPPHTPLFIVGHGMANADHEHFIATQSFWKDHPESIKPEKIPQLIDEGRLISGKKLNHILNKTLSEPAIWYVSCHAGGNCAQGGNIGASCSSWETTALAQVSSFMNISLKVDPATRRLLMLLCEPDQFQAADTNHNQWIEGKEWLEVFKSDYQKKSTIPVNPDNPDSKSVVLKQLPNGTPFCDNGKEIIATSPICVNSASSLSSTPCLASPVLSSFALPKWEKQIEPAAPLKHHEHLEPTHR